MTATSSNTGNAAVDGNKPSSVAQIAAVVVAWLVLLTGCETAVDPVIETDIPYTMYGLFNPTADTQAVRVYPVNGLLERSNREPLGAVVTSTNLETGQQRTWADSIITFPRNEVGHVYWSAFNVGHEETYRLEVERPDGAKSEVVVTTPPVSTPEVSPADISDNNLPISVLWRDAPNLIDVEVVYRTNVGIFTQKYGINFQNDDPNGRVVVVQFRRDTEPIILSAFFNGIDEVRLA
ncbi:MAG: DUF4249 family protein, partial [Rhodothermales bacterium]|nr:DUF4249 family protein [Rhodothermales bacterium]